jgi:hypothetical protein
VWTNYVCDVPYYIPSYIELGRIIDAIGILSAKV